MSKILVSLNIDVTKLKKELFYKGSKGTYCEVSGIMELSSTDEYGNSGFFKQSLTKDERQWEKDNPGQYVDRPILGNFTIPWRESGGSAGSAQAPQQAQNGGSAGSAQAQPANTAPPADSHDEFDDDIPF